MPKVRRWHTDAEWECIPSDGSARIVQERIGCFIMTKTIITVATTGAWPKKENNPNVPMTPAEISEDVYACWKAGAAVAHLHMRDDDGNEIGRASCRERV